MSGKAVDTDLDAGVLHNSEWVERWAIGKTGFHQSKHDPFLDTANEKMFEGRAKSVFLPLCGKTPDIIWMYQNGHTVCGVEIAEQPIRELFEENNIPVGVEDVENVGKLYKSNDGRIQMYVADLFDLTKACCGQFDVIWDSRSLVAINLADHDKYRNLPLSLGANYLDCFRYRDLLLSLMKPNGQYYLSTLEYEPTVWPGPPHTTPDSVVQNLYKEVCSIEMLEEVNRTGTSINEVRPDKPAKKLSSAGAAIKTSPYVYDRWYQMTFK